LISRDYLKIKQKLKFSIDKMSSERGEIRYCTPKFTIRTSNMGNRIFCKNQ